MFTYALLTLPFLALVLTLDLLILKTRVVTTRPFWVVLAIMLVFTAVFDQLLTGLPIVLYDFTKTLGLRLWHAPIEDLSYTIAAVIGIGALIVHHQRKIDQTDKTKS